MFDAAVGAVVPICRDATRGTQGPRSELRHGMRGGAATFAGSQSSRTNRTLIHLERPDPVVASLLNFLLRTSCLPGLAPWGFRKVGQDVRFSGGVRITQNLGKLC
jgi:hypothetical protein